MVFQCGFKVGGLTWVVVIVCGDGETLGLLLVGGGCSGG